MRIYKYPIQIDIAPVVLMPEGAKILTAQVQGTANVCIWAIVDERLSPTTQRRFAWFGTGHPMPSDFAGNYIATVQLEGGALVFHLFELP